MYPVYPVGVLPSPKDVPPPEPVLETPDMSAAALRRKLPAAFLKRLSMPGVLLSNLSGCFKASHCIGI
jgi:hypothetical protein